MTKTKLQEIRSMCDKASSEPWIFDSYSTIFNEQHPSSGFGGGILNSLLIAGGDTATEQGVNDLKLCAASRTLIPELLDEIKQLRKDKLALIDLLIGEGLFDPENYKDEIEELEGIEL